MSDARCPICQQPAATDRAKNRAAPFCSERCRMVDLGRWLGEGYRIPAVEQEPDAEHVPPRSRGTRDDV